MRPLEELLSSDSAWPLVQGWLGAATNAPVVLAAERDRAAVTLHAIQVTTRSAMGAIAWHTGGVLIDHGWVRLLGSGCALMSGDLAGWDGLGAAPVIAPIEGAFVVAHDVVGGFFAINGGAFGPGRSVFYLAPDSLVWEDLERGYTDFVRFLLLGDLAGFYGNLRFPEWEAEVGAMTADEGFSLYPPPWTVEGKDLSRVSRRAIPMREVFGVGMSAKRQLGG
jgi:hypothetical protein